MSASVNAMLVGTDAVRLQRMAGDAAPRQYGGVLRILLVTRRTSHVCSDCFSALFQFALQLQVELPHLHELRLVWLLPEPTLHGLYQALDDAP